MGCRFDSGEQIVMRLVVITAALAPQGAVLADDGTRSSTAAAGFRDCRWGMTPSEVEASAPGVKSSFGRKPDRTRCAALDPERPPCSANTIWAAERVAEPAANAMLKYRFSDGHLSAVHVAFAPPGEAPKTWIMPWAGRKKAEIFKLFDALSRSLAVEHGTPRCTSTPDTRFCFWYLPGTTITLSGGQDRSESSGSLQVTHQRAPLEELERARRRSAALEALAPR